MSRKLRVLTRRFAIATLVVLVIATGEKAAADPILLDQQHLPPPEGFGGPGSTSAAITFPDFGFRRAQTFTVGREGRLVRVDVLLADIRHRRIPEAAIFSTTGSLSSCRIQIWTISFARTWIAAPRRPNRPSPSSPCSAWCFCWQTAGDSESYLRVVAADALPRRRRS
jgi:hypothetical protein